MVVVAADLLPPSPVLTELLLLLFGVATVLLYCDAGPLEEELWRVAEVEEEEEVEACL